MTPVQAAISSVGRALGSFHPASVPVLSRAHYRREIVAWLFLPIMMGAVEGGVVGVIAKTAFTGVVSPWRLDLAVAILTGAPAFANITSFLWASATHGRNKIRALVGLQIAAAVLVAQVALAPANGVGLLMLAFGAVGARVCWAGVATLRATVWRANYPRAVRANLAGKLAAIQAVMLAGVGLAIAFAMRADESSFHWLYPMAAGFGVIGAAAYSRMRMRGHVALIAGERRHVDDGGSSGGVLDGLRILRDDARYRRYMNAMFVFGIGNIALAAPMVIMLHDRFGYQYLAGILVMGTIPVAMMPLSIPFWSRLLDRMHIIRFRMYHCWAFVAATACVLVAALGGPEILLWIAAAIKGIAYGGGVLAWNLGHTDFAPAHKTSQYMGVHVTLTGIRGLIGPTAAVALYRLFEEIQPNAGGWVFAICLALNLAGAWCFHRLAQEDGLQELTD